MKIPIKIVLWNDKPTFDVDFKAFVSDTGVSYEGTLNEKGFDGVLDCGDKDVTGIMLKLNKTFVDGNLVMDFGRQTP